MIRKFKFHPLAEVREIGDRLYHAVEKLIPGLIIRADSTAFKQTTGGTLDEAFLEHRNEDLYLSAKGLVEHIGPMSLLGSKSRNESGNEPLCTVNAYNDVDREVICALLSTATGLPASSLRTSYYAMPQEAKRKFIRDALNHLGQYDALPREFETGVFTLEVIV
jgi:hypothetical protein